MRRIPVTLAIVAITLTVAGCGPLTDEPTSDVPTAATSSPTITGEPAEPDCLDAPPEISAAGLQVVGCILDISANDSGGSTFHAAVNDRASFDTASDDLTAIGMEIVYCTDVPLFCGWSTSNIGYNADLTYLEPGGTYAVPVLEYETWGF